MYDVDTEDVLLREVKTVPEFLLHFTAGNYAPCLSCGCLLTYYCCQVSDILVAWLMLVAMPSDVGGAGAMDITKRMRRPVVGQNCNR